MRIYICHCKGETKVNVRGWHTRTRKEIRCSQCGNRDIVGKKDLIQRKVEQPAVYYERDV